jgi:hypothetical protein
MSTSTTTDKSKNSGDSEGPPVLLPNQRVTDVVAQLLCEGQVSHLKADNKELKAENKRLRRLLRKTNKFLSSFMVDMIPKMGDYDPNVPAAILICGYCYDVCDEDDGGICPCHKIGYCSTECQREHWKEHHKHDCPTSHHYMERVD